MAPTIVRDGQFRLFFFSREETRIHVHVAHQDGEAKFWDPLTGRLLGSTKIKGLEPEAHVNAMTHHPEHNVVVITPQNGNVLVWDYKKKDTRAAFTFDTSKTNPQSPEGATLSSDGKMLVVAGGAVVKRFDAVTSPTKRPSRVTGR